MKISENSFYQHDNILKNSSSKILILTQYFLLPSEVFLYRQITGLKRLRAAVVAYHRTSDETYQFDPVFELAWNFWPVKLANAFLKRLKLIKWWDGIEYGGRLRSYLKIFNPDLINLQGGWAAARLIDVLEKVKIPIVVMFWGSDINASQRDKTYHDRLHRVFKRADYFVFLSEYLKSEAVSLGCPEQRTYVVYPGVEMPADNNNKKKIKNKFQLISIGRLTKMKGHHYLLHAMRILIDREVPVELILVGEGELRNEIETTIKDLNLSKHVNLLGSLSSSKAMALLAESDALVLPSVRCDDGQEEAFGVVLIEAGAYMKPVIGTRIGGIPEIIIDNVTGFLVPEKDSVALVDAITKTIKNPVLAAQMGKAGKERVKEYFELHKQNAKFEEILLASLVNVT